MNTSGSGLLFALLGILATAVAPQQAVANEHGTVTRKIGDDLFMAGGDLRVGEAVAGDAILAGGEIVTSGAIRGDQVVAGGQLRLGANTDGGLYAAGGRVHLDGRIGRNARVAGGEVEVGPDADVQGGLRIGGGRVEVSGRVGKYLQIGAGRARIDGHVGGDVDVASGELNVGPSAVIDGTLTYYGPQPATVVTGAQVKGGVHFVERTDPVHGGRTRLLHGFGVGAWLWLIGWIIAGGVLLALWPGFAGSVTGIALSRPGMALLIGFAVLVCAPVVAVLLMITIVGIPLALLAICLYLALLPLGYLASAAAVGEWLLSRMRRGAEIVKRDRILMLVGALVALFVLTRIPVLGGIVGFLVVLAGVGSLVMAGMARYRQT